MPINIGQQAPEFALYDTNKQKVALSSYRGKNVILLFFPFAFSSVCTREMCEIGENYSYYTQLNAEVIGISVDSLFTNKQFREEHKLNFPLLSDFNKEVAPLYDSLADTFAFEYSGVAKRSSFVIDRDGSIVYMEILKSPGEYPDMQKLKEVVAALN
ncbi:MAG: redoxin domain-containing protein [Chitinophagales bacterium]|nr:redoxin domain-containing protein [Chitinophagales bacterium]